MSSPPRAQARPGDAELIAPIADLLGTALEHVRQYLDPALPAGERLRSLWAGVFAARDLAASDVIEAEFMQLANDVGLRRDLGRRADEDLQHVIRWAQRGWNPFQ